MPEFPYCHGPQKMKVFLQKIQEIGQPDSVNQKWLSSIGFSSSNDRTIVPVLKFVGFISEAGNPTDLWKMYRDKLGGRRVLAAGVKSGYGELYSVYPDAHCRSEAELRSFFSTRTKGGTQVVTKMMTTFTTLCTLSDFELASDETSAGLDDNLCSPPVNQGSKSTIVKGLGQGLSVSINIQLAVPETTDELVYDRFFAALKKHLLS